MSDRGEKRERQLPVFIYFYLFYYYYYYYYFWTCGRVLLQSAATGAKKLLVYNKITACVKDICLLGVVCKVSNRKTLSSQTVCFPEKRLLSILSFARRLFIVSFLFFFYELLIGRPTTNILGMYYYFLVIRLVNSV